MSILSRINKMMMKGHHGEKFLEEKCRLLEEKCRLLEEKCELLKEKNRLLMENAKQYNDIEQY